MNTVAAHRMARFGMLACVADGLFLMVIPQNIRRRAHKRNPSLPQCTQRN